MQGVSINRNESKCFFLLDVLILRKLGQGASHRKQFPDEIISNLIYRSFFVISSFYQPFSPHSSFIILFYLVTHTSYFERKASVLKTQIPRQSWIIVSFKRLKFLMKILYGVNHADLNNKFVYILLIC